MARKLDLDKTGMDFTRNWFRTRNLATFREYVHPKFADKPTVYLELGVFEGMSMAWMLQKVLTHSESRSVGIDPWLQTRKLDQDTMDSVRTRAFQNVEVAAPGKCQLIRGNSVEVLGRMHKSFCGITKYSVDICQIDGDHTELAAWNDARFVYPLLKIGGWMLFDDVENNIEKAQHVKHGLARFMEEQGDKMREIWRHKHMVCLEKVA